MARPKNQSDYQKEIRDLKTRLNNQKETNKTLSESLVGKEEEIVRLSKQLMQLGLSRDELVADLMDTVKSKESAEKSFQKVIEEQKQSRIRAERQVHDLRSAIRGLHGRVGLERVDGYIKEHSI